jgi:tetratricopeptide (TPR) repeat protein
MDMEITTEQVKEIVAQAIDKGFEHFRNGANDQAEAIFEQILCVDEDNSVALQMLGLIQSKKPGMCGEAIKKLKRAEELEPNSPDVHNNLGLIYSWSDEKDIEKAEYHYRRALELNPDALHFWSNLGIHLKAHGRVEEAEEVFRQGLARDEANAGLNFNFGTLLGEMKRYDEAAFHYQRTLAAEPDNASAHYNLASLYLNQGNLVDGWPEYEWRWETYPQFKRIYTRFPLEKRWDGKDDPAGKKFFLYAEQGMGDTIQFCRFVKNLKERGAYITLEEAPELQALMRTLDGPDRLVTYGDKVEEFDYHCSVVSLPYLLGINDLSQIDGKPYLSCNYEALPEMTVLHDKYWNLYKGLRVGIVWAGNPVHRHDPWRSTYLANFRCLQIPGVKLFSLQKDVRPRFWPGFGEKDLCEGSGGMGVVDLKDFMLDYNCTAALIDRMDLVICVDTATAHLAGAIGKPVWLLVSWHNDWRWLAEGKTTPWYDSLRIYRQPVHNDWESVFKEVRDDLVKLVG